MPAHSNGMLMHQMLLFIVIVAAMAAISSNTVHPGAQRHPSSSITVQTTVKQAAAVQNSTPYLNYSNATYGLSIEYPSGWTVKNNPYLGPGAVFGVLFEAPVSGPSIPDVSVEIFNLTSTPSEANLTNYTDSNINSMRSVVGNATIISLENITLAGHPGGELRFEGAYGRNRFEWLSAYTVTGYMGYIIAYAAGQDQYAEFSAQSQDMINSFKLSG